jgi:hypothetical protein
MASLRIASSLMLGRLPLGGELIGRGMPRSGPVIYRCTIMPLGGRAGRVAVGGCVHYGDGMVAVPRRDRRP